MYLSYYNLKSKPFPEKTAPAGLWLNEKTKEARAVFRDGIMENKGLMLLTGGVGTGKTSFIHSLLSSFSDKIVVGNIVNPGLDHRGFLQVLADIFHLPMEAGGLDEIIPSFKQFLLAAAADGKRVLLVIDEAQQLDVDLLQLVLRLADLKNNGSKLLNILLVSQNDFNAVLFRPEGSKLHQKITVTYNIVPLTKGETAQYIKHHLRLVGGSEDIFSPAALDSVFTYTGGSPRLINLICDLALLGGFTSESPVITKEIVSNCSKKLMLPPDKINKQQPSAGPKAEKIVKQPTGRQRKTGWQKPIFGLLIIIALIFFGARQLVNKMEKPEDAATTSIPLAHNGTKASPKAEIPPLPQTQREFVTMQPAAPAAGQAMKPPAPAAEPPPAAPVRESAPPRDEARQIAATEDISPVLQEQPRKTAAPSTGQAIKPPAPAAEPPPAAPVRESAPPRDEARQVAAAEDAKVSTVKLAAETAPDSRVVTPEKLLPAKRITAPEISTSSEVRNGSKKVLTVFFGNLRDGPSLAANIIGVAKQGDIATALRKKAHWYFVRLDDGRLGWMHQSLFALPKIAIETAEETAAPSAPARVATATPAPQPKAVPKSRVTVHPLPEKKAQPKKEVKPAPTVADTSPLPTPPAQERAATEPVKTAQKTPSGPSVPTAVKKPIEKTGNPKALEWTEKSYKSVSQGKYNLAIVEATKAIALDPGLVNPYINRAWAYCETGLYEKAIADCHTALALEPKNALAFNNLGLAFHRMQQLATAREYYKKACDLKLDVACSNYKLLSAQ